MKLPLLLDEHVPPLYRGTTTPEGNEFVYELTYVIDADGLGRGADDQEIVDYASDKNMIIITNDDDFLGSVTEDTCIMYYPSQGLNSWELTEILAEVCKYIESPEDLYGEEVKLTRAWLD